MWFLGKQEIDEKLDSLGLQITLLAKDLKELQNRKPSSDTSELSNRVADLEIKIAKIWHLAITTTPNGQEKLTKVGRKIFGGGSKFKLDNQ